MRFLTKTVIIILLSGIIFSCTIERKIAKDYIELEQKGAVLLFSPDFVYKVNLKPEEIESPEKYAEYQMDSLLLARSLILKNISDSSFLVSLINNYIDELKVYGFEVFTPDYITDFMNLDTQSYVVNIAQLELEEYFYEYEFEEPVGYYTYTINLDLNAVNYNTWFEISEVNGKQKDRKVLFATHYITDDLYGHFKQQFLTGEVKYEYTIDTISLDKIYELAAFLGREYASYTFDHIMNQYIRSQIVQQEYRPVFMHYDRQRKMIFPNPNDRFIEMEE